MDEKRRSSIVQEEKNEPRKRHIVVDFQKGIFKDSTNPADPEPEHRDAPDEDRKEKRQLCRRPLGRQRGRRGCHGKKWKVKLIS